jgi:hypothetical protein
MMMRLTLDPAVGGMKDFVNHGWKESRMAGPHPKRTATDPSVAAAGTHQGCGRTLPVFLALQPLRQVSAAFPYFPVQRFNDPTIQRFTISARIACSASAGLRGQCPGTNRKAGFLTRPF